MYADDTNLFLSKTHNDLNTINMCLEETSYAIRCKFNLDKTDVVPIGSPAHKLTSHAMGVALPGAFTLAPRSTLRVLSVWIGSTNEAAPHWKQVLAHNHCLISQWTAIGISVCNGTLIAKALLLSHCYYLLDGNGIPLSLLNQMCNAINWFMRGHYSSMPYRFLPAPLSEGSLNCPSLIQWKTAYDLKFISDLFSGPQDIHWKVWTWADIIRASSPYGIDPTPLNPFL